MSTRGCRCATCRSAGAWRGWCGASNATAAASADARSPKPTSSCPRVSGSPPASGHCWPSASSPGRRTPRSPARSTPAATRLRTFAGPPSGSTRATPLRSRGTCRSMRPITAAATSMQPSCPIWIVAASSRCSTGATGARSSAGFRPCPPRLPGDRGRLDRPLRRLAPSHPRRAAARSDRLRPLPPRPRGQHRAGRGPPRPPTPSQGAQPPRARCGGQDAAWRPERYRRPPPAAQSARALDQARASPVERALRARADHRRGAGAKRDLR
jgi:hypothetical protein